MGVQWRPLRLGDLSVRFPVVPAALAGYSDLAYRLICRRLGAEFCSTEMMLDQMLLVDGRLRRRLVRLDEADHPVAGQLIGNTPEDMAAAAAVLCAMGFDVVDLNFACPVRKALRRRRGGWLMTAPEKILEITRAVLDASTRPVTLKLRRRFANADDDSAFWRVVPATFEAGVAAVCVHARSVEQKYFGPADWEFLAEVKRRLPDRVVLGSGDVLRPADALALYERTGVDGVVAARGCLGNPWFFRQVADLAAGREPYRPSLAEQRQVIREHFDASCRLYGEKRGSAHMRKFGIKYARMHPRPRDVRMAFVAAKNARQWHEVLEKFYGEE